jgi:uncharacterized protein YehS (DUF1456 family)
MTNNDIFRRIRYIFDFNDDKMMAIFALADVEVSRKQVSNWLRKEDAPDYEECADRDLATFLNGLIIEKRGRKDGPLPYPEDRLSNNMILVKLKIALNLQAEDLIQLLKSVEFPISKHELSAFFRRPTHKHYRECKDQIIRNVLKGLQLKYRDQETRA